MILDTYKWLIPEKKGKDVQQVIPVDVDLYP